MSFGKKEPRPFEKRQSDRRPANLGASIVLDSGERVRCLVKNFSKTGALLVVPSILGIPQWFELQAGNGPKRRVEVVRRHTSRLGVRFV